MIRFTIFIPTNNSLSLVSHSESLNLIDIELDIVLLDFLNNCLNGLMDILDDLLGVMLEPSLSWSVLFMFDDLLSYELA